MKGKSSIDKLVELTCCLCGVTFGMTQTCKDLRRADFRIFYCPNGHTQSYVKDVVDPKDEELSELKKEVAELRSEVKQLQADNVALTAELEVWKPRQLELAAQA